MLEREPTPIRTLHLRDLELNAAQVTSIACCLKQGREDVRHSLTSISFSNNPLVGDVGGIEITKCLPTSICEIGLVNCGIGDVGGMEILNGMKHAPHLTMVCIEGNNFSEKCRSEFKKYKISHPHMLFVF